MAVKICEHCLNDYNATIGNCPYCNREKLKNRIAELEHTIEKLSRDIERRTKMYVELEAGNERMARALRKIQFVNYLDVAQRIAGAALEETKPEPNLGEDIKCIGCGKELCGHEKSFCMGCITGEIPKMLIAGLDKLEKRVEVLEENDG